MRNVLIGSGVFVIVSSILLAQPKNTISFDFGTPLEVVLTDSEVSILSAATDAYNTSSRVDEDPWTIEEWLHNIYVLPLTASANAEVKAKDATMACEVFRGKSDVEKRVIITELDGHNPCVDVPTPVAISR